MKIESLLVSALCCVVQSAFAAEHKLASIDVGGWHMLHKFPAKPGFSFVAKNVPVFNHSNRKHTQVTPVEFTKIGGGQPSADAFGVIFPGGYYQSIRQFAALYFYKLLRHTLLNDEVATNDLWHGRGFAVVDEIHNRKGRLNITLFSGMKKFGDNAHKKHMRALFSRWSSLSSP